MVQDKNSYSNKELYALVHSLKEDVKMLGIHIRAMRKEMKGGENTRDKDS